MYIYQEFKLKYYFHIKPFSSKIEIFPALLLSPTS